MALKTGTYYFIVTNEPDDEDDSEYYDDDYEVDDTSVELRLKH